MKLYIQLLTILIVPALIFGGGSKAFGSEEGYKKASKYMVAANRNSHPAPEQKRDVASSKNKKKKKSPKRKVASVKDKKSKKSPKRKVASTKDKKKAKGKKKKKKPTA